MSLSADMFEDSPNELALSIAWHAGLTRCVTTTDGQRVDVVFPGHWTHGLGPDFRGAMLSFPDGRLLTGDVELHFRASDWDQHHHHTDPAYNDVILHIVTSVNGFITRRANGGLVPTARLGVSQEQLQAVHDRQPALWAQFGGDICAPELAARSPSTIRAILHRLGDIRLEERVATFESALSSMIPADVLLPALFASFGYARNRDQMEALANRIPWNAVLLSLASTPRNLARIRLLSLLLGVGGWLPLSPAHARIAMLSPELTGAVEREWDMFGSPWHAHALPSSMWDIARVRPANHPVARIATLAALLAACGSRLIPVLHGALRDGQALPNQLQEMIDRPVAPALGADRAIAITASVVIPFAVALARATDDPHLEEAALVAWSSLSSGPLAQPARRAKGQVAGESPIRDLKERGNQGLLLLDKRYCSPRRCYECPVAREVVATSLRPGQLTSSENS